MKGARHHVVLVLVGALSACAPAAPATRSDTASPAEDPSRSRTLTIAVRSEASSAAAKALQTSGSNITPATLFNAGLAVLDERQVPQPYLAETFPQLNTDSWRLFPDGRMETTYRLKPNLIWHDGAPLSTEDFAFALRIYTTPELGTSSPSPQNLIEEIVAADPRTLVIRWRQPYAEAGALEQNAFQALPRHILEESFQALPPDGFAAHPFWTTQYVGLGPYRIERWEPGISLEAVAFDGYVRGRPRIGRIRVVYMPDPNTVLANLLAETVDVAAANSLPFHQSTVLRREWEGRRAGIVLVIASGSRVTEFQLHPDRVASSFQGTLDARVRRAMAHAIDKQGINDAVFDGQGLMADARILPNVDYFAELERLIRKYPFDLRRSERLMTEAGYARGPDGIYVSPAGARFSGEDWIAANPQSELTQAIMLATWKQAGFDISPFFLSTVQQREARFRAERPGLYTGDGGSMETLGSSSIPAPENRWTGSNRGSYSSPEYDRSLDLWRSALDRSERNGHMVQMARLYSEDLPSIPLHYNLQVTAHVMALRGPTDGVENIHAWDWRP